MKKYISLLEKAISSDNFGQVIACNQIMSKTKAGKALVLLLHNMSLLLKTGDKAHINKLNTIPMTKDSLNSLKRSSMAVFKNVDTKTHCFLNIFHLSLVIMGVKPAVSIDDKGPNTVDGSSFTPINEDLNTVIQSIEMKTLFPGLTVTKVKPNNINGTKIQSFFISSTRLDHLHGYFHSNGFIGCRHPEFDVTADLQGMRKALLVNRPLVDSHIENIKIKLKRCMFDNALRGYVYGFEEAKIKEFLTMVKDKSLKDFVPLKMFIPLNMFDSIINDTLSDAKICYVQGKLPDYCK